MAEYRLSPAAQRDLDSIYDYTVAEWGLEQAVTYTEVIENACAQLAAAPMRAPVCGDIRQSYRRWRAGQHVIYFRLAGGGISIIRILHHRMNAKRNL